MPFLRLLARLLLPVLALASVAGTALAADLPALVTGLTAGGQEIGRAHV
jgi:hypothetical protein